MVPAADAPLLLFDSGIGGLSVLEPVRRALPRAPIVYAADYAGLPYGEKSEAELAARVPALLGRLAERYRPRLIVIACNTASTIALAPVRAALDLPVVGTVPAIKPAAALTSTGVIGLLGTAATVRQSYVDRLESEFVRPPRRLIRQGAPALVAAAEDKLAGRPVDRSAIERAVGELVAKAEGGTIDTVVLACTHFPFLREEISAALPGPVRFVDGSEGIARRVAHLTQGQSWPESAGEGRAVTTGPASTLDPYRTALAGFGLTRFESL